MSKIEEALWQNYKDAKERVDGLNVGSNEYEVAVKELDNIRNELIKLEQINQDSDMKLSQIKAEDKREKTRNLITIGTFAITTGVSLYGLWKTFDFDGERTVTSTLGRGILNDVWKKIFKK